MTKKETEIIVDDETEASVTETISADGKKTKRVNYSAKIKENEVIEVDEMAENQDESFDDESDFSFVDAESQEIPKNQLTKMFDDLRHFSNDANNYFYALASRIPDAMNDNFFIRCNTEAAPIHFQFSIRDMLNFTENLQKVNNNSGGRFNVSILAPSMQPLQIPTNRSSFGRREVREVGLVNFYVPNPQIIETPQLNGQPNQNGSLEMVFSKMAEMMQQNHNQLLQIINRQPEKSTLEKAIEQKMLNDLLNPPEKAQDFSLTRELMQKEMFQVKMISEMFAKPALPPPEKEPSTMDTVKGILETPMIQDVATTILNAATLIVENKMQQNNANVINNLPQEKQVNPQPQAIEQPKNEMENLIIDIITELETENPLNENNEFLQDLEADYPNQSLMIKSLCKTSKFDVVLNMLVSQSESLNPNPFIEFLDIEQTQITKNLVWNERGNKLIERLKEFYEFAKK